MNRRLAIGVRRGIRTGVRTASLSLQTQVAAIINSYGTQAQRAWFRADGYTVDGVTGKVGAFVDRLDATHVFAQTTGTRQVAVPTADTSLANALSAAFSAHWYDSNRPAASFRPYHDGTGCTVISVFVPSTVASGSAALLATRNGSGSSGDIGFEMRRSTANIRALVQNESTLTINLQGGTMVAETGYWSMYQFLTSRSPNEGTITLNGTQVAQANAGSTPPSGDPNGTLRLGALRNNAAPWLGTWAESMLIPGIISTDERDVIYAYFLARYGLAA